MKLPGNVQERSRRIPRISGKCPRHFRECSGTFPGNFRNKNRNCSGNVPGKVQDISGNCSGRFLEFPGNVPEIFGGNSRNNPGHFREKSGNVQGLFWEFPGIPRNCPGNVREMSGKCPEIFQDISWNFPELSRIVPGKGLGTVWNFAGISRKVLRGSLEAKAELLKLCQRSWDEKNIPDQWRLATVVLLYKKGDTSLPENYRPISLLPVGYKVLAMILQKRLQEGRGSGYGIPSSDSDPGVAQHKRLH